jgi:hypothetical protein
MKKQALSFAILLSLTSWQCSVVAQVVFSTFDTDLDGWTVDRGSFGWADSGADRGGELTVDNHLEMAHATAVAPLKFLGDWSVYNNAGTLRFDHKISTLGSDVTGFSAYRVVISGPGGEARWTGETPNGLTDWTHISIPLEASAWSLASGSWPGLLENVTSLRIRMEQVLNATPNAGDLCHLDNVVLSKPIGDGQVSGMAIFPAVEVRHRLEGVVAFGRSADITIHPAVEIDFLMLGKGEVYQLEWASELKPEEWIPLGGPMLRGNSPRKVVFDTADDRARRFYRLVRLK